MNDDIALLELSRWTREAQANLFDRVASNQAGECFEEPTTAVQAVIEEAVRLAVIALFAAVILTWAAILQSINPFG